MFILLFLTYWIVLGGGEAEQTARLNEVATTTPRSFTQQMTARVDAETMRAETQKAAQARALKQQQKQAAEVAGLTATHQAAVLAGPSPDTGQPYTEQEWELRENLRMESIERRSRSLRSSPVAQSYRTLDTGGSGGGQARIAATPTPQKAEAAAALQQALDTMHTATSGLEHQITAEAEADQALIAALTGRAITPDAAELVPAPTAASVAPQDYSIPARLEAPQDPPDGSVSMKARSSKRSSQPNLPATTQGRYWPWFPCPSIRRIGNASLSREERGLSAPLRPSPTRIKRG